MRATLHAQPIAIVRSRAIPVRFRAIPAICMTHDDTSEFIIWNIQRPSFILVLFLATGMIAQSPSVTPGTANQAEAPLDFVCPMHPDVHMPHPGHCPRCGMALVANLPDRVEYPLRLAVRPSAPKPGQDLQLAFTVFDPKTERPVTDFQTMHEKLYHLFIVSQDLDYFRHDHPELGTDGVFHFSTALRKPGMYRILSDFYPTGGTPQLIVKTLL